MAIIGTDILKAKEILTAGGLVAIPTETVYGLAANAFDASAASKIFEAKNRPSFDPLIAHTDTLEKIRTFTNGIPERAQLLAERFWPGPLTLLLERNERIPDLVNSGLEHVAVRIPNHPLTLELLGELDFPLAAPSANPFGYVSPTCAKHVNDQLGEKIPYILDGGHSNVGIESTIIGFENGEPMVYRLGGLSVEAVEEVIGAVKVRPHSSSNPKAPGMLKSHYSPDKKVTLDSLDSVLAKGVAPERVGVLTFGTLTDCPIPERNRFVLSENGDMAEAATRLFSGLRYMDSLDLDVVVAELLPEEGLGRAINDRLRRSAA
ncbi:threonylcarbamoyl-AMP synthase [Fulvitalea axinellae]|uniref:Threonylcarbamoyl-AMP synthase n=1 Tax=Fulvitalea axinellae TaxID=1182444 RepID=A0AAU9CA66_9BACT|nr:threonylcarbamoyl-AMP synthase [Fulvitalea axinellae]